MWFLNEANPATTPPSKRNAGTRYEMHCSASGISFNIDNRSRDKISR